jgi:hypothetical protein
LVALNTAKPATAAWHKNNSQRLLQLADQLRDEGRIDLVRGIATSALQKIGEAERAATTPKERAGALATTGYIQERFFGDKPAALRSYEAAAASVPEAKSLKDSVSRLRAELAATTPTGRAK